ncbi:MAG TPA: HD-GYP domain-containing protein [Armatimonadota bacterium]|nr:HD-GYP domain-containing protein [Armatimonadota bacterium]HOP81553.1 HD-GYP domain-containing protein [Armatimonadota bacterium]HPP76282.1 HD-GYP domain-containing protein [Armatimonadota bacterium]
MFSQWNTPVILAVGIALVITLGSTYYSTFYQPRKMERAYKRALYALAAAVETRDSGTIGHARRVADYAVAVAEDLGIDKKEQLKIEYAALLRDIGKVNVPAALLNKSTPLTVEEWEHVKTHSQIGAEMVQAVPFPFLSYLSDIILHHHECWDGSGYPDNLQGEEIPLASRILAVTTDYDAITSDRPYHESQPHEVAIAQIKSGRGTRYDPAVVDAFLRVIESLRNR